MELAFEVEGFTHLVGGPYGDLKHVHVVFVVAGRRPTERTGEGFAILGFGLLEAVCGLLGFAEELLEWKAEKAHGHVTLIRTVRGAEKKGGDVPIWY